MKLKEGFITHTLQGQQMMVAAGPAAKLFRGVVRSNETAAFIIDCLKEETTPEQIVDALCSRYEAPRETIAADVEHILNTLCSIHALEE